MINLFDCFRDIIISLLVMGFYFAIFMIMIFVLIVISPIAIVIWIVLEIFDRFDKNKEY